MNASSESGLCALTISCGTDVIEYGGTSPVYTGMEWHGSRGKSHQVRQVSKNDEGGTPPGSNSKKLGTSSTCDNALRVRYCHSIRRPKFLLYCLFNSRRRSRLHPDP